MTKNWMEWWHQRPGPWGTEANPWSRKWILNPWTLLGSERDSLSPGWNQPDKYTLYPLLASPSSLASGKYPPLFPLPGDKGPPKQKNKHFPYCTFSLDPNSPLQQNPTHTHQLTLELEILMKVSSTCLLKGRLIVLILKIIWFHWVLNILVENSYFSVYLSIVRIWIWC